MPASPSRPRLFIGSSSEGRDVARHLQAELDDQVEVRRWDQSVFEPGGYTLDSLITTAKSVDFAVLVATPDDTTTSRGTMERSARDNIVLEFGLFAGVLGRERTYLLATGELKLPTDVLGLTRLPYHPQTNMSAAVNKAALQIEERVHSIGSIERSSTPDTSTPRATLDREIDLLCNNAVAQGWTVKTNSATTLRLRSPRAQAHTLPKGSPEDTRADLRGFAAELRAAGLRVNSAVRKPTAKSPL
ncbi:MAG: nucleotide-binding protein [Tomitella sp.]|nr:nucleotide-binding protein [Tomitella sp.]